MIGMCLEKLGRVSTWFFVRSEKGRKRSVVEKELSSSYSALLHKARAWMRIPWVLRRSKFFPAWCRPKEWR
jgi:hypothetical protein